MENAVEFCDQKSSSLLVETMFQGKELAEQLRNHYRDPASSPPETSQLLLEKILHTQEKALSLLNKGAFVGESPRVLANVSPKSDVSDPGPRSQFSRDVTKRRKTQPRWTEQVKVCSGTGTGLEGPLDDGYSWRKYGQKSILGSNFPRGYYRCTHQHSQGCLAIKQVQRSDQDHNMYEVTYRGRHTCSTRPKSPLPPNNETDQPLNKNSTPKPYNHLEDGLNKVIKIEGLDSKEDIFQPFSFPPASIGADDVFVKTAPMVEDNFLAMSPYQMDGFGMVHNAYQMSESGLTDIVSAHSSVANSPIGAGLEIPIDDSLDFEEFFQLGNDPVSWLS